MSSSKELYEKRKRLGLCTRCGGEKPKDRFVNCEVCRAYVRAAMRRLTSTIPPELPKLFEPYEYLYRHVEAKLPTMRESLYKIVRVVEPLVGADEDYFAEEGFCNGEFEDGCVGEIGVVIGKHGIYILVDVNGLHLHCERHELRIVDPC